MFNTTKQSTTFNAPATGVLQKSHDKSFFETMYKGSGYADKVFGPDRSYVVLQVLLMSDDWLLVELVSRTNWKKAQDS